jgi:hypothetical protein
MNLHIIEMIISAALLTLIWLIQLVHYPIFYHLDEKAFFTAMKEHQFNITIIVMPLMLSELLLRLWQSYQNFNFSNNSLLILTILIWLSTFFIQVPLHQKLLQKKEEKIIKKLIQTNWIRTFLWSSKFLLTAQLA